MTDETGSVLEVLEATRRRRAICAEGFRATLAGLDGVHVHVEPINADAEAHGLRRADLRTDVESALREDGMTALTQTMLFAAATPGTPVLHVDVMTVWLDGRYAYSVRLELWQSVRLTRAPSVMALALTWSAPQIVGVVAVEHLADVRDAVRAAVAGFLEDCHLATSRAAMKKKTDDG
ncbi:MAG: hypothetical protein HYR51_03940 [Candidatus Rokubacteria bacterium]|nr:hypothetical protein [Candidatus Rokubacteria bacterium]